MSEAFRRLLRPVVVRLAWWLTTHPGMNSPCDDDHCIDVRNKARGTNPGPEAMGLSDV